jgi:aminoglycoside phosphotransferase (APT) family kinase protein
MPEIDLLALLQTYYAQAFPDRQDLRVSDLVCLSNGWESDVYSFTVTWGPADQREDLIQKDDLILRIYPGGDAYEKSANEFRSLSLLHQAGYPVPRVDRLERDASPFGQPFLIMERIYGRPMWPAIFHSLPWERKKRLRQFCRLFAQLHALNWRPFVPNAAEYDPTGPYDLVERQLARWRPLLAAMPLPGFKPGWDWLEAHRRDVTSTHASPVHWDFHPNNILIKDPMPKGTKAAGTVQDNIRPDDILKDELVVIDWTGLDLTDYRFDLGWTLLLLTTYEGDRWRGPILREYERQAGHPVEGMEYFDAVAALRRLVSVVGSLLMGAEHLGMRPGAEEVMRKQVKPLRRVYARFQAITHLSIPEVENLFKSS